MPKRYWSVAGLSLVAAALAGDNLLFLGVGWAVGFIVQKSDFCFLGAISDLRFLRDGRQAKAILLLLALSLPGFELKQYLAGASPPIGHLIPVGAGTLAGGFLFGLGMALAGGCILSTLARVGAGSGTAGLALAGVVLGGTLGAWQYDWRLWRWPFWGPVYLPEIWGWIPAFMVQIAALVLLWRGIAYLERRGQDAGYRD